MLLLICIAWLYVALMITLGAPNAVSAIFSFVGWGVIPVGLLWFLFGRGAKVQRIKRRNGPENPPAQDE